MNQNQIENQIFIFVKLQFVHKISTTIYTLNFFAHDHVPYCVIVAVIIVAIMGSNDHSMWIQ